MDTWTVVSLALALSVPASLITFLVVEYCRHRIVLGTAEDTKNDKKEDTKREEDERELLEIARDIMVWQIKLTKAANREYFDLPQELYASEQAIQYTLDELKIRFAVLAVELGYNPNEKLLSLKKKWASLTPDDSFVVD